MSGGGGRSLRARAACINDVYLAHQVRCPPPSVPMASADDAASLLPDRLRSLQGFVLERLLNDGAEGGSVNGARMPVTVWESPSAHLALARHRGPKHATLPSADSEAHAQCLATFRPARS